MTPLIFKDVPTSDLQELIDDLKSEGMNVVTTPEDDGQWTVTATPNDKLLTAAFASHFLTADAPVVTKPSGHFSYHREKFFAAYEMMFGSLASNQRNGLKRLIDCMERDSRLGDLRQCAYILATVKWETAHTFEPVNEFGSEQYFNERYGSHKKVGKRLGNIDKGDGARYHGRGYVQLTGRNNYAKFGLDRDPDQALQPDKAYEILVRGMLDGMFGSKLSQHIKPGQTADYGAARRSVNGTDHASDIASIAAKFESILNASITVV